MEAHLRFKYHDEKIAEAVSKAIRPDNLKTPDFMIINTFYVGDNVIIKILYSKRIETLLATVDDLLLCVNAIEECIEVMEKMT
jgi:hypothetical protein